MERSTKIEAMQRYAEFYRRNFSVFSPFGKHHCAPSQVNNVSGTTDHHLPRTQASSSSLPALFRMPVVYAEERLQTGLTTESEQKALTTLEEFERRRPKIVVTDLEVRQYLAKETGRDRLRDMYSLTDRGDFHPNLALCIHSATMCTFGVFMIMSMLGGRAARLSYIERSKQTVYATKFKAIRAHNDAVMVGGLKTGMLYGFKTGFFALAMLLTSQSIAAYRNKTSPWEYMIGGALTGAIWRINMGLKGMVGGASITAALGFVAGVAITLTFSAGNATQQRRHYWEIDEKLKQKKESNLLQNLQPQQTEHAEPS